MSGSESCNLEVQEVMDSLQQQLETAESPKTAEVQSQLLPTKGKGKGRRRRKRRRNSADDVLCTSLDKEQEFEQEQLGDGDSETPSLTEQNKTGDETIELDDEASSDSIDDITDDNLEQILKKGASQKNTRKVQMAISFARIKLHEAKKIEARIRANKDKIKSTNIVKPTFSSIQVLHPLNFIENLTTYLEKIDPKEHTVDAILDCLEGDAKSWAAVFKSRWANKEDFIMDFFQQYWGRAEQSLLKKHIYSGRWNRQNETMSQHLTNLIAQAKWLPNQIPDDELVFEIMQHFPKHIQFGWSNSGKSTIIEAMEFLRSNDEIEMLNREKNAGFNQGNNSKFPYVKQGQKNKSGPITRMWQQHHKQNKRWVPQNYLPSENVQMHSNINAPILISDESQDRLTDEKERINTMKPEDTKDTGAFKQKYQIIH